MKLFRHIFYFIQDYILIFTKHFSSLGHQNPPTEWQNGPKGDVIVIPGYIEKWIFLETIIQLIHTLGYRIHILRSLEKTRDSYIAAHIVTEYIKVNKLDKVTLLSHSQGGLVAKLILNNAKYEKKIKTSISIASPYGGTLWGVFYFFSLNDLWPKSALIADMQTQKFVNSKIFNLYPKYDNHVIPHKHLILDGAQNICLDITGHTNILESPLTLHHIATHLN